jgi:hypothetical protein
MFTELCTKLTMLDNFVYICQVSETFSMTWGLFYKQFIHATSNIEKNKNNLGCFVITTIYLKSYPASVAYWAMYINIRQKIIIKFCLMWQNFNANIYISQVSETISTETIRIDQNFILK